MNITNPQIDSYCQNHSTLPSKDCERIFDYTIKNVPMAVMLIGPLQGSFLGWLVKQSKAKRVLEIGTFTGYSALCMAEQLPADGQLITLDIDPETSKIAKGFWKESAHGHKIRQIVAPALETLKTLQDPFDFIFIDADKENYPQYFDSALQLLSAGGMIALDNCLRDGKVLNASADPGTEAIKELNSRISDRSDLQCTLVPIRDGLMLVQRS